MVDLISALLLMPILLLITLLILFPQLYLYQKIFFVQQRPGKGGKIFGLIKFQTMHNGEGNDQQRLTRFGDFLRKTALDELPQVLNILKGDMSFIGPRPLLPEYQLLYSSYHAQRHLVKPGITGLAQVKGQQIATWEEKLDLDVEYAIASSFSLDCSIAWKTICLLVSGAGQSKEILTEKFTGYE